MRPFFVSLLVSAVLGVCFGSAASTTVTGTIPTKNQVDVNAATNVTARFDTLLSSASVNDTTFLVFSPQRGRMGGAYTLAGGDSNAVFNPDSLFRAGAMVEVVATTGITSAMGTPSGVPLVWRFTVATTDNGESLQPSPSWISDNPNETHTLAMGDYDGDGDVDMACIESGVVRLYRNDDGDLEGALVWTSSGSVAPRALAWGDYDGDGDLDLVCGCGGTHANVLYRNDAGTLTSSPVWTSTPTNNTESVDWGDYDGDGDLDLVFGNLYTNNTIYRNDDGVFTTSPVWTSTPTNASHGVEWGDYDNDGDLDLAFANAYAANTVYRNDGGSLTTSPVWSTSTSVGTYDVAWGDYDGDGDLDLAFGNVGANRIYRNDAGTLTTTPVWSSTPTSNTYSVAWGDYDGDGDLDLGCGNGTNAANNVYRNDGGALTTSAAWTSDLTYRTSEIVWVDIDNDGDLDMVCGNGASEPRTAYYNASAPALVSTSPTTNATDVASDTDVSATFDTPMDIDTFVDSTFVVHSLVRGKMAGSYSTSNGDQTVTLYADSTCFAGEVVNVTLTDEVASKLLLNPGGPHVWTFTVEAVGDGDSLDTRPLWSDGLLEYTRSVAWADVDNDGDLDLACSNYNAAVPNKLYLSENGRLSGTSIAISASGSGPATADLAWGDFDGDGDVDVACANLGANTIHQNTGGTIATAPVWSSTPSVSSKSVAWGDYDGDGDLDLAFGNDGSANTVYRNDGGTFTTSPVWSSNPACATTCVLWLDYDKDGDLDLLCGNANDTEANNLYRNDGGVLTANPVWSSYVHYKTQDIAVGDYNGDGWIDIALGNFDQYDEVYYNYYGTFNYSGLYTPQTYSTTSIDWVDYDGDGDLDLACGTSDDGVVVYRRVGSALQLVWSTQDPTTRWTQSVAWADFDGDGDMDFARGGYMGRNQLYVNGLVVASSTPAKNNYHVSLDTDVDAAFITATDPGTISGTHFKVYGAQSGLLKGQYSTHTGDTHALFEPDSSLHAGEEVEVVLTPEVTSASADRLTRGYVWRFAAEVPSCDSLLRDPIWSVSGGTNRDVAWGDYDGDGDLDLACGRAGTHVLYENLNGVLSTSPVWTSSEGGFSGRVGWVDYDGDGDLDLTIADGMAGITLHRNDAGVLTTSAVWSSSVKSGRFSWGDYDGDGDPDLACTRSEYEAGYWSLFRNDDGTITTNPVWSSQAGLYPVAVAWADYDRDWDLDIMCATWDDVNLLYNNDGGAFDGVSSTSPNENSTACAAWGDYDADGNLDVAFGNDSQSNTVYEVQSGALTLVWTSTPTNATTCVSWVDYDGDGDLDLAFGNNGQQNTIYRNDGGTLTSSPVWTTTPSNDTYGMDWGDVNGDGDIDVVYACTEGLFLYGNTDVWAPSPVSDLAVVATTDTTLTLTWTATGDDSTVGTASYYDVRYSNLPITDGNFASATTVADEPVPHAFGSPETFHIEGLTPGLKYYVTLRTADADSNWSNVSNNASAYTKLGKPAITSIADVTNDQGKEVTVVWNASVTDHDFGVEQYAVTEYSLWRRLDESAMTTDVAAAVLKSEKQFADWYPKRLQTPVIDVRFDGILASGTWLYLRTIPALQFESYAVDASTAADSAASGIPYATFMVSAMTANPLVHAESAPDSGYSVDNLSPGPPQNLILAGAYDLSWDPNTEGDLDYYAIYANDSSGAAPDPDNRLGCTSDTTFTLPDSAGAAFIFVTAVDFNGNESAPSNEISIVTLVDDHVPLPTVYALHPNVPNPFNPRTTIAYDVPSAGQQVSLRIYDVTGRLVCTLLDGVEPPGRWSITWDGRDRHGRTVASGVYFCRMSAPGFENTRKMIMLK